MKKQKTDQPHTILEKDLCFNLRKVTRAVTKFYDRALKPLGIRSTQLHMLMAIQNEEGMMMKSFSENFGMDRTTLTRNMKVLERRGFISEDKATQEIDKRMRCFKLTDKGRKVIEKGVPVLKGLESDFFARFGPLVNFPRGINK